MKSYAMGELMTDEDSLAHYGVKGMKWGVRGSKSATGISRGRGAVLDRNARSLKDFKEARKGNTTKYLSGSRTTKAINITNNLTMGRTLTNKYYDRNIKALESQSKRIKDGQLTINDRLDVALRTPLERLVTVTPK